MDKSNGQLVNSSGLSPDTNVDRSSKEAWRVTPAHPTNQIPNGGFEAWLQCAGSFFLFFNGFGMVNTFGELQVHQSFFYNLSTQLEGPAQQNQAYSRATTTASCFIRDHHPTYDGLDLYKLAY